MRRIFFTVLIFFGMISGVKAYVWDNVWADKVIRIPYILDAGQQYTFETRNLSYGGDTIMYLVRDNGNGSYTQVAYNDDCPGGGLRSCITYTPTQSGAYWIIIRSYSNSSKGYCDYFFNNQNILINTFFGGTIISTNYTFYVQDKIYSLIKPDGTNDTHLYFFTSENQFITMDDDGGIGRGSRLVIPSNYSGGKIVVAKHSSSDTDGYTKIILNSGTDYDGDGLKHNLENYLMTCEKGSEYQNNYCNNVFNPKDTDGDGIDDFIEVVGCDRQCVSGGNTLPGCYGPEYSCSSGTLTKNLDFPQYLYNWGASPRRKDVFFEMDYECEIDKTGCANNQCKKLDDTCFTPDYRPITQDAYYQLKKVADKFREDSIYSNTTIINPDGTKGVFVHFDRGHNCSSDPDYPGLCGNWGGMDAFYYGSGGCTFNSQNLTQIRRGIFHHFTICMKQDGGGQTQTSGLLSSWVGREVEFNTIAHESGHQMGIGDNTGIDYFTNGQPHWTGLNNYLYSHSFNGSVENVHFSDGRYSTYALNPSSVCEYMPLGNIDYNFLNNSSQKYFINNGKVDWNRDGYLEDNCSNKVKGYIHFIPYIDSAGLRYRQNLKVGYYDTPQQEYKYKSDGTPQLVTYHDVAGSENASLYLFTNYNGYVYYRKLDGMAKYTECLNNRYSCLENGCNYSREFDCACDQWGSIQQVNIGVLVATDTESAPALAEIKMSNGNYRLYMVFRPWNDQLHYKYLENGVWSNNYSLYDQSTKEVSLVNYRGGLVLVYRSSDGRLKQKFMDDYGNWGSTSYVIDSNGNYIYSAIAPSVAIRPVTVFIGGIPIDLSIAHLIYAESVASRNMRIAYYSHNENRWYRDKMNLFFGTTPISDANKIKDYGVSKKVGFWWYPDSSIREQGGRFYIMYTSDSYNGQEGGIVYYGFTSVSPEDVNQKRWDFNIHSTQDNGSTKALTGVSMIYFNSNFPNQININGLVAAYAHPDKTIRFLPYASGIYDFDLHDQNDWLYIDEYSCKSIRSYFGDQNSYCKSLLGLPSPPPLLEP